MRVALIGTAGRRSDQARLSLALYARMLARARSYVFAEDHLQSGGAAWADHLAVLLYLDGAARSLTLYLPEHFDLAAGRFLERGPKSCGAIANYYHRLFSQRIGTDSLDHICCAADAGARLVVVPGFHERNLPVGRCDRLVAFTFGEGHGPADGGTKHCWDHSTAPEKVHVPLARL